MSTKPDNAWTEDKAAKLRAFLKAKRESLGQPSLETSISSNQVSSAETISNPESWLIAFDDAVRSEQQAAGFSPLPPILPTAPNGFRVTPPAIHYGQPDSNTKPVRSGTKSRSALNTLEKVERELQLKREAEDQEHEEQKSYIWILASIIAVLVPVIIIFAYQTSNRISKEFFGNAPVTVDKESDSPKTAATQQRSQSSGNTRPSGIVGSFTGSETKVVRLPAGTATFTINRSKPHHLHVVFNSGLIADVDWKENSLNEFGYDIYEPEVSETTNRLALMLMLRGIIANYLNGKY